MTKYRVTWTKGDGVEYTENFTSDAIFKEQVGKQFIQQVAKRQGAKNPKVLRVEELEESS